MEAYGARSGHRDPSRVLKNLSGTVSTRNRLRAATEKSFVFKSFAERRSAAKRFVSRLQGFFITLLACSPTERRRAKEAGLPYFGVVPSSGVAPL